MHCSATKSKPSFLSNAPIGKQQETEHRPLGHWLTPDEVIELAADVGEALPGGATSGIEFTLIESSTWTTGFCADATVTNATEAPVLWEAREAISGTITSIWNAEYRIEGDDHVFTGAAWNSELPAFRWPTFGFCGVR